MKSESVGDATMGAWVGKPPTLLICTRLETRAFMHTCPHAQTLEAYSQTHRCTVWIPLACKQWKCRFCAERKVKELARRTETAKPNRLLTLTVDTKLWDSPRCAFDGTRRQVSELGRKVRKRFEEFEYLRVTELTRGGWPHYHLLVRSPYLPHATIKSMWHELTGAVIVDLRRVKSKLDTFYYLVKYLSKLHNLGWTDRHVSYSKRFFPEKVEKLESDLELVESSVIEAHPAELVYNQYRHATLMELTYGVFTLLRAEQDVAFDTEVPWCPEPGKENESCVKSAKEYPSERTSQKSFLSSGNG